MQKKEYYDVFNSGGNSVWLDSLFNQFLDSFDENIALYDLNRESGTIDGSDFYDRVAEIENSPTMVSFQKNLPGGEYLIGFHGTALCGGHMIKVVAYGVGSPLASAETAIIIQAKDRERFESTFSICNPWI